MDYNKPLQPGCYYHIFNHAVGSENLFRNADNYRYFLKRYSYYIMPVAHSYAYCLLPNHFHFLIRIKTEQELWEAYRSKYEGTESKPAFSAPDFTMQCFSNLLNSYAKAYNKRYLRKGALFLDYLRRKEIENKAYFANLVHYIHYNAVHHGFCTDASDWEYSSYHAHFSNKPTRLQRQEVISWFNGTKAMAAAHEKPPRGNFIQGLEF